MEEQKLTSIEHLVQACNEYPGDIRKIVDCSEIRHAPASDDSEINFSATKIPVRPRSNSFSSLLDMFQSDGITQIKLQDSNPRE